MSYHRGLIADSKSNKQVAERRHELHLFFETRPAGNLPRAGPAANGAGEGFRDLVPLVRRTWGGHIERDPPGPVGSDYQRVLMPDSIPWTGHPDIPPELSDESGRSTKSLFKKASESVYPVVVGGSGWPASPQFVSGSAVAVSESLLITNCQVTGDGARDLYVGAGGDDKLARADLVALNYARDRCVVSVHGLHLHPIVGVRRFDTLEIGETVYSIGNPAERSLSQGVLSGIHVIGSQRYLETTAATSLRSPGGGLFDSRGNLIGIMTTTILSQGQGIDVAIPAEDFWK
jgi:S1-C subfamily serine protease